MNKIHIIGYLLLITAAMILTGCAQPTSIGGQSNVGMVEDGSRVHLDDRLTGEDFVDLSRKVTEKMIASRPVQKWATTNKRPLLVVAVPDNTTHDANILAVDLQDEIISTILDADIARVIDESSLSSSYDYILKTTITDTSQRGAGGSKLTYYTVKLQLFSLMGERIGQWHDKIGLAKAAKSFF
ncbi:hypothetical protein [Desulforhopalus sp. 52FAK]